jgi:uncharacterized protein YkwD
MAISIWCIFELGTVGTAEKAMFNHAILSLTLMAVGNSGGQKPAVVSDAQWRQDVIELTNRTRAKQKLPPFKGVEELMEIANLHASDMATKNYFDHTSRDGRTAFDRIKPFVPNGYTGENIAAGQETPTAAVAAWLKSPGHRANIMNENFREIGVGFARNAKSTYGRYWVQVFCGRDSVYPIVINLDAYSTSQADVTLYIHGPKNAERMRIRNNSGDFGPWQPYRSNLNWRLGGSSGKQRVEVEVEDSDGLPTRAYDEILLSER